MFSGNLRIFLSEITILGIIFQIFFGSGTFLYAINPPVHELVATHSATTSYPFVMSGTTYIAVGNKLGGHPAEIIVPSSTGSSTTVISLPDSAHAFEKFVVSGESYLAVANTYTDDAVYMFMDGQSLTGNSIFPSDIWASDYSFFTDSGSYYLAVANENTSSNSKIYQWTGTGFDFFQDIGSQFWNSSIEYFTIIGSHPEFLPYAEMLVAYSVISTGATVEEYRLGYPMNRGEAAYIMAKLGGYTPTNCTGDIYSDVNNGANLHENSTVGEYCGSIESLAEGGVISTASSKFKPYEKITRGEGVKWILGLLGEAPSRNPTPFQDLSGQPNDVVGYIARAYDMGCIGAGDKFYPDTAMTRGEMYKFAACAPGLSPDALSPSLLPNDPYIALGNGQVYSWSQTGTTLIQDLNANGPSDIKYFSSGDTQMLGILDHGGSGLEVFTWTGAGFSLLQRIQLGTSGGTKLSFDTFESRGNTYLVTPRGSGRSSVFIFANGQFELIQSIGDTNLGVVDLHDGWSHFTLDSKDYLFLANAFNSTNSAIYEWSPLPYVSITGPVSGEIFDYGEWDPALVPVTGKGSPNTNINIYDGTGVLVGAGVTSVSGEFSILTTASSGSALPIRIVPFYTGSLGEEKTLNYLNIRSAPVPSGSHPSNVYRDPFTFTITADGTFYGGDAMVNYFVYTGGLLAYAGQLSTNQSFTVSGEDLRIEYYGESSSGVLTPIQTRSFIYDNTSPSVDYRFPNSLSGTYLISTVAPAHTGTNLTNAAEVSFFTGSQAGVMLNLGDDTLDFSGTAIEILSGAISFIQPNIITNLAFGNYGMRVEATGSLALTGGLQEMSYGLTDLAGNSATGYTALYRITDLTDFSIYHTGGLVYASFEADISSPVNMYYIQGSMTGGTSFVAESGMNTVLLTGAIMTGSISAYLSVAQMIDYMTIPSEIYETLGKETSYTFDPYPDTFSIMPIVGISPGMTITFPSVTLSGFNMPISASILNGVLRVNGLTVGTGAMVSNGDVISISLTTGSSYSTSYTGQLFLGDINPIGYLVETSLAPMIMMTTGGGGGAGSSSPSISASSSFGKSEYSSANPMFQGLLFMNPFLQKKSLIEEITPEKSEDTTSLSTPSEPEKIVPVVVSRKVLVNDVVEKLALDETPEETIATLNKTIQSYSEKMKSLKITSPEYKVYRAARKELRMIRKEYIELSK